MMRIRFSHVTKKRGNHPKDKISQLPDEIIVSVLSHLTINEAARTSVLSRRWEKLWTFVTSLNFDASKTLFDLIFGIKISNIEKPKFISWLNQALKSHQGQTIDEFRVHFFLHKSSSSDIDNWINFAMKRRVQRLELELGSSFCCHYKENYTFPLSALEISSFNSLKELCLSFVDVTGEVLEHFLYNCRFLERLWVKSSRCLVNLKVSGLSLKLKNLEISYCWKFESIDISANNLESFKYFGHMINNPFKNFRPLVEASFGGDFCKLVINNFRQFSSYFTQLETLILNINTWESTKLFNLVVLNNVKHLELKVWGTCSSLPFITSFIKAFPFLHRFVLRQSLSQQCVLDDKIQNDGRELTKCPHQCLKVVELLGFFGCPKEVEIAMYFLVNAVSIEKIVFDTRDQLSLEPLLKFYKLEEKKTAKKCARQLGGKLPPGVNVVVI